jgi:hypothetical protein
MEMNSKLGLGVVVLVVSACSSAPRVTNVSEVGKGKDIAGIPFRIKTEQTVRIWRLQDDDTYKEVSVSRQVVPDYARLYAIDVRSDLFASPTLKVTHNPDNTLKLMKVASTNNTSGGIDAINSAVAGVVKAQNDKAAAKLSGSGAIATAEKAVRDAQAALDGLDPTKTTAETRATYERYVESAKRQANDAYSAAGLPRPYPEF